MRDKELSQWFDINVQKPWEPGVYEVQYKNGSIGCAYFNGNEFTYGWVIGSREENIKDEFRSANECDSDQPISWRGLASNHAATAKPKPKGNRKVTRYVVMDPNYSLPTPVATYACKENAQERKQAIPGGYILKIRFRTPEA